MGWLFTDGATKKDIIAQLTKGEENKSAKWTCIAKSIKGNVLWVVWEVYKKGDDFYSRFIACNLLQKSKTSGWGYKDMEESIHPYYYTCPLSYLSMVSEITCQEWRDEVYIYHERLQKRLQTRRSLKVGDLLELVNSTLDQVRITNIKPLQGEHNFKRYRIPTKFIGQVIESV